ncbi:MAG: DUF3108 domain-containing protein [bacterium]|nr:DUF3108 domain-containing protein [bacterium]
MKNQIVLISLLILLGNLSAQNLKLEDAETKLEEKFVYNVGWTFLHIGTITLCTERLISYPELIKITMDVKTASLIPFINIDEHNVAIMRESNGMTYYYYGKENNDGKIVEVVNRFYETENFTLHQVKDCSTGELICKDTIRYNGPYLVGTSLVNYTRIIAAAGLVKTVPTLLGAKFYPTTLNFCGPVEFIETGICDEPVRSFKYTGSAEWEGNATAGLSGDFTGWFSDDSEKVVIYAEMEILLGSIDIELSECNKSGWTPPTSKSLFVQTKK